MKPLSTPFTTFTDRMRGRGNKALYIEYAITICCGLGYVRRELVVLLITDHARSSMLFGYDQGVFGGLLDGASFMARFPSISNGNSTLQGFTVGVATACEGYARLTMPGRCLRDWLRRGCLECSPLG
jgi:hypothetical protein